MPNKHKGEVALTVDGNEYVLRFTFLHVAELEDLGLDVFDPKQLDSKKAELYLTYALCKGQHGLESLEDASNLLMTNYKDVSNAVVEATTLFFLGITPKEVARSSQKEK